MHYRIQVFDSWGKRIAAFDDVPLFEAVRRTPDREDSIRGLLPAELADLGHVYTLRVLIDGQVFCEGRVTAVLPEWSDARKLILDRYVYFRETLEVEAGRESNTGNEWLERCFVNQEVSGIVRAAINHAAGPAHYTIDHEVYPEGAVREFDKFTVRRGTSPELEVGGIGSGDWAGSARIDASGAHAKSGDTIAGLVVDDVAWPDVRLMMVDCEEVSLNARAMARHPETAEWTGARYAASGYAVKAEVARAALQALLDERGIDWLELNPHVDSAGGYDGRVDADGRYVGLAHGDGQCLNAAMVELGAADAALYGDGALCVPDMELKDFFSYEGPHADSIEATGVTLGSLDVSGGLFEVLTLLAYAAGGFVWSMGVDSEVRFRRADRIDAVHFFDRTCMGVALGSDSGGIVNVIDFTGNPVMGGPEIRYSRDGSAGEYGVCGAEFEYFAVTQESDAARICEGLLDDLAYPAPDGSIHFRNGNASLRVGDLVEVRGEELQRRTRRLEDEWGGRFEGRHVGRVTEVCQRLTGGRVETVVRLGPPLRSCGRPLTYITRSQPSETTLYQFRLDDEGVGTDAGFHLD